MGMQTHGARSLLRVTVELFLGQCRSFVRASSEFFLLLFFRAGMRFFFSVLLHYSCLLACFWAVLELRRGVVRGCCRCVFSCKDVGCFVVAFVVLPSVCFSGRFGASSDARECFFCRLLIVFVAAVACFLRVFAFFVALTSVFGTCWLRLGSYRPLAN